MLVFVRVGRRVLAGRVVTAAHGTTGLTEAQVDPVAAAGGKANLAAVGIDGRW